MEFFTLIKREGKTLVFDYVHSFHPSDMIITITCSDVDDITIAAHVFEQMMKSCCIFVMFFMF